MYLCAGIRDDSIMGLSLGTATKEINHWKMFEKRENSGFCIKNLMIFLRSKQAACVPSIPELPFQTCHDFRSVPNTSKNFIRCYFHLVFFVKVWLIVGNSAIVSCNTLQCTYVLLGISYRFWQEKEHILNLQTPLLSQNWFFRSFAFYQFFPVSLQLQILVLWHLFIENSKRSNNKMLADP